MVLWGPHGEDHGRVVWAESFLILTKPGSSDALIIDCDGDLPTSPVTYYHLEDAAGTRWTESIGELVERWLRAMETRIAHFDRSRSRWTFDSKAIAQTENI